MVQTLALSLPNIGALPAPFIGGLLGLIAQFAQPLPAMPDRRAMQTRHSHDLASTIPVFITYQINTLTVLIAQNPLLTLGLPLNFCTIHQTFSNGNFLCLKI
jgi:hypothetical protein